MLSTSVIIRAWKSEDYRHSLSSAEQASLPVNPAGSYEIGDEEFSEELSIFPSCYPSAKPCSYSCDYKV